MSQPDGCGDPVLRNRVAAAMRMGNDRRSCAPEVLRRLRDVVGDLPVRADGNINQRDLWNGLADALGVAASSEPIKKPAAAYFPTSLVADVREFAEGVKSFLSEHAPDEWDGGSLGYEVGGLIEEATELLAVLDKADHQGWAVQ